MADEEVPAENSQPVATGGSTKGGSIFQNKAALAVAAVLALGGDNVAVYKAGQDAGGSEKIMSIADTARQIYAVPETPETATVYHDPIVNRDVLAQGIANGDTLLITAIALRADGSQGVMYSRKYGISNCPTVTNVSTQPDSADSSKIDTISTTTVAWQKTVSAQLTFSDNPPPKVQP